MTEKQIKGLKVIQEYIDKNKYAPTVRELGEKIGLNSAKLVHSFIRDIEAKGYISSINGCPSTIKIIKRI
ncbi:LexA family transcriptional regulator [Clostridium pasteurianum DSM 525 = ATCC 6013]|uniref:LexA family transcriptional regulator n=1 Tax=Clostridium pasteurianum DSM 525 = ATCC 6013 TaxID=1262449 RepID=A0A0H3JAZ8_CLOPA|nr:LexA family transcriptional regulator [Clostridium pasteurianum DSM 525 = ATCC 6013]AJA54011.1 LexA family transcriptional regulator [Clostridium pasteurianum DSM 525 = ATCC 6013]KRU13964.1 transcriptional repressor, LexA family [Clostridium pasteurianum DSM 525 = ATCC 6013]